MLNLIVSIFFAVVIMILVVRFMVSLLRMIKTNRELGYIDNSPYMRNRKR